MNTYKECDHGIDSQCLFSKSPYVMSGHFHHKDHRKYKHGDIVYLGSPYQQNFGDMDSSRGIYIFDLATNEYEFIENTVSPVHWKISLHKILEGELTSTMLKTLIPNNMISFLIDREYSSDKLNLLISKLQNLKPKFFRTEYQNKDINFEIKDNGNEYNGVDIPKSMEDFIEVLETPFKKEINEYLKDLYAQFSS
jgi:DNA repair exonuclease SbcCD nuclease subunit